LVADKYCVNAIVAFISDVWLYFRCFNSCSKYRQIPILKC